MTTLDPKLLDPRGLQELNIGIAITALAAVACLVNSGECPGTRNGVPIWYGDGRWLGI